MNKSFNSCVTVSGLGVSKWQMTGRSEIGVHITGTTISETFIYDALNRLTQD